MTRAIRAGAAMLLSTGLLISMAACSSTGDSVAGSASMDETPVTDTVTETVTPTDEPEPSGTSEPAPTGTDDQTSSGVADEPQPDEPENPAPADDACRTADLDVGLQMDGGAAGSMYYRLEFTNTSDATCTMHGFPEVMYVKGDAGTQVGAAATRDGEVGTAVTLEPGGTAVAMLQQVNVYNFDADACDPVDVRGIRVYPPGQDKAAFVKQDDAVGCEAKDLPGGQFQMSVQAVTADE